jgi:hypothetical protein
LWDSMNPEKYKPFNILVSNRDTLVNLRCDHEKKNIHIMRTGLHISTGLGLNTGCIREQFLRKELVKKFNNFSAPVDPNNLLELMSSHNDGLGSEDSVCVHDSSHHWETRSSSGIILSGVDWHVRHTNGAPCVTPVIDNWDSYVMRGG